MQYRCLGGTDVKVSVIAMGCWSISDGRYWGQTQETEAIDTINAAIDSGINFFDTAEVYGAGVSETLLGKGLGARRADVVIASKVAEGHMKPHEISKACEDSLGRLQTDHIDLYQIHWRNRDVPLENSMGAMQKLKDQGKIRMIGVSNFGPNDIDDACRCAEVVSNQLAYNLLFRAIEFDIVEACLERNIGILTYSPLLQGVLAGKYRNADQLPAARTRTRHCAAGREGSRHGEAGCEDETFAAVDRIRAICEDAGLPMSQVALAWLVHQQAVTSVLAGVRRPDQIQQSAAVADIELSADTMNALSAATDELKQALGANADMWQSDSRLA